MTKQHTATPWHHAYDGVFKRNEDESNVLQGGDVNFYIASMDTGEANSIGIQEREANAAYIVKAVNNHERLVSSLRFLVDAAKTEPGMAIYKAHIEGANAVLKAVDNDS